MDNFDEYVIEIRRTHVLADCMRAVDRHGFDPTKCIKVLLLDLLIEGFQGLDRISGNAYPISGIFHWRTTQ